MPAKRTTPQRLDACLTLSLALLAVTLPATTWAQDEDASPETETPRVEIGTAAAEAQPAQETEAVARNLPTPSELVAQLPDAVTFDVPLSAEQGGGRVTGVAGDFDVKLGQYLVATDGVILEYQDLRIEADKIRVDIPANTLTAEGDVVLDEGPRRLTGQVLEWDIDARTGRITQARAEVSSDYFFSGAEIRKTGANTYLITDGIFTSCEGDNPSWSLAMSRAEVTIDGYARIRNARLKFKSLPVFYAPYILWPATVERSSGWLVPKPGNSDRRGVELGLAYYQILGRSADTTFFFDLSTEEFYGVGNEIRYRPSEHTQGEVQAYFRSEPVDAYAPTEVIFDPDRVSGDDRWKLEWEHQSNSLWGGWKGVIDLNLYSDFDYLKDLERNYDRQSRNFIDSKAFLSRNSGPHSFNLQVDQRQRVLSTKAAETRRQLPEMEYRLRELQLGGAPIYFSFEGSAHYLQIDRDLAPGDPSPAPDTVEYGRVDIAPQLSFPLSTLPWLSFKVDVGGRFTYYSDSLDAAGELTGDTVDRTFETLDAEIIGPSFSRIFELSGDGRFSKLKHLIEPRVEYGFLSDYDDVDETAGEDELAVSDQVPLFDELDRFVHSNAAVVSLTNRFLAKPSDEKQGGAFEVASFEISQAYSFDDELFLQRSSVTGETETEGPLRAEFRLNPSRTTYLKLQSRYDTLIGGLESVSLSGGTKIGDSRLGLTYSRSWREEALIDGDPETIDPVDFVTSRDQVRFSTSLALGPRFTVGADLSLDLLESETLNQRFVLDYQGACYRWTLEYRETLLGGIEENDVRFLLNLKNVGTFLDINDSF